MLETKEQEFITCRTDQMFKSVVIDEKNPIILEGILSNIFGGHPKVITLPRTTVPNTLAKEKAKDRDLVIELNGEYINLEVVTGRGSEVRHQLFTYHISMWKQNIIVGSKYAIKTKFIQVVLQYNLNPEEPLIRTYKMESIDEETGKVEVWIENFYTIQINMERLKKMWYNGITSEVEKYKYLIMLDLNKEELERLEGKDSIMKEYEKKVVALNENPNFINTITKEKEREYMHNTALERVYEEGICSGVQEGEKKKELEIAKKMLFKEKSIEEIMEFTNLTKEEIEMLQN